MPLCDERLVMTLLPAWLASMKAEIVADREIITEIITDRPRGSGMLGGISFSNLFRTDIARACSHIRNAKMINRVKMSEPIIRDVNSRV
jgi:hypothetical protein